MYANKVYKSTPLGMNLSALHILHAVYLYKSFLYSEGVLNSHGTFFARREVLKLLHGDHSNLLKHKYKS